MFFKNWESILKIIATAFFSYVGFLIIVRIAGKRALAKLNAFDLIVTVAIGSLLASTITSDSLKILEGLAAASTLLLLQFIISKLSVLSDGFEKLIKAEPALLFYKERFNDKIMRKNRVSKREVLSAIRASGIYDITEVHSVILETDGKMSVLTKSDKDKAPSDSLISELKKQIGDEPLD